MSFPFPPLWMRAEDGSRVDVSGIYWFVIAAFLLYIVLPMWAYAMRH
jgi:hypothetical protein